MDRIEAIPLKSMRLGMRWDWETFPEYLDSLDSHGLGLNVGALFPFSPMRGYVLGMYAARERTSVTDVELNEMKRIFHESMKAGAFGFALDKNLEDRTEDGSVLPTVVASDEEFLAMARIMRQFGVGHIGVTIGSGLELDERTAVRNMTEQLMRESGRPLHLLDAQLGEGKAWMQSCRADGLPLVTQLVCTPFDSEFKLSEYNLYDYMPNWVQPLVGSGEERAAKLRVPETRAAMKEDVEKWPHFRTTWSILKVLETAFDRNEDFEGMTISELSEKTGKHPVDAFLDLALDEGLETTFALPTMRGEAIIEKTARRLNDPYGHISVSDGGAHTKFATGSTWPIYWLQFWIRDREIMSLEQAHYKMSALPAWLADFKDRGVLRVGAWADIMVYNIDELGFLYDKAVFANDFPGDERRLIQKPTGLRYTIVNGTVTFEGNDCTGALPGKLLRSCDMVG
jgi:N-acyl-D-amino-acid deacylase